MADVKIFGVHDDKTVAQIQTCANTGNVVGAALMADGHYGYSQPIGGVVVYDGQISPSGVGYDIACVDGDSEYLSPSGWMKISLYNGSPVMQYEPNGGIGSFVHPSAYITKPCDEFLHFKTKFGVDQMVDETHRMLVWRMRGGRRFCESPEVISARNLADEHNRLKLGARVRFETSFSPRLDCALSMSDAHLRVQIMFLADGTIENKTSGVVSVIKERKVERARRLLEEAVIDFSENKYGEYRNFRFSPPLLTKAYDELWNASANQLRIIADECIHWDGNSDQQCFYSRDKDAADFIQYAFSASGYRAVLLTDNRKDGGTDYRVFRHTKTQVGIAGTPKTEVQEVQAPGSTAYCFTVPSGFWVMRRNGKVVITGNCGNKAVRTNLKWYDIQPDISRLMDTIQSSISFGVGRKNAETVDHALFDSDEWNAYKQIGIHEHDTLKALSRTQLGTVGSGNHYVDIFVEESTGDVWVGVHFGSRGFGHKTASGFLNLAAGREFSGKAPGEKMEQPPALLDVDSEVGQLYLTCMKLAGQYAYAGRDYVVNKVLQILGAENTLEIHNHHNFAWLENGKWVVRKGATPNAPDQLGFIGGSMCDEAVITVGLHTQENRDTFYSTVHGAGRVMSRTQAAGKMNYKTRIRSGGQITPEQMQEAVKSYGVELRGAGTDESPFVYRRLADVLEVHNRSIRVLYRLKPVGVCMAGGDEFDPYKD